MAKKRFEKLSQPLQIGNVYLKNRMVKAAYATFVTDNRDGRIAGVGDSMVGHIAAIARGGAGLIITESCAIDYPLGQSGRHRLHITQDDFIEELSQLPKITHRYDCPIFLQLHHAGPSFSPVGRYGAATRIPAEEGELETAVSSNENGIQPVAASSLNRNQIPIALRSFPRGLSIPEIKKLVENFAEGAKRALKAGFDGVELHFAHGYLLNSFLSRVWNHRDDAYGFHNTENRSRFGVEIISRIKEICGGEFPIGVRINGKEWGADGTISSEDSQAFAKYFQEAGAAYIHVTGYGYGFGSDMFWMFPDQALYPVPSPHVKQLVKDIPKPGAVVPYAEAIKKEVSIPVIVVDSISPELGEWVLRKGKADLIAFARRLIADPELPNKVVSGRIKEVSPCTSCMTCISEVIMGNPIRCRINPRLGKEWKHFFKKAETKKRVLVVGGGPAGMEAAVAAAKRGHKVHLYEKNKKLGGLLLLAAVVKGSDTEDLQKIIDYYKHQMNRLGVKVTLGKAVDLGLIKASKPDVLVIAAGGRNPSPDIGGITGKNVVTSISLKKKVMPFLQIFGPNVLSFLTKLWVPIGKKVVIVGGSIQGCEIAEFLVKRGRNVTLLDEDGQLGAGIPEAKRLRLIGWLMGKNVQLFTKAKIETASQQKVCITTEDKKNVTLSADHVIIISDTHANKSLVKVSMRHVPEIYVVGDSENPGLIVDAIADGFKIGNEI